MKKMNKIGIILILTILPASLFANTLLETSLAGYDPYLADKDGFDSLFINPAGMAGQSQYFTLSVDAGTWGELDHYKLLAESIDAITSMAGGGTFTVEQAEALIPLMADNIDQATMDELLAGTSYAGTTVEEAQDPDYWAGASSTDLDGIATNLSSDEELQAELMNQFDEIAYSVEAGARLGTLIKGFGFGLYGNTYFLFSLGAQGIQDMIFETGAVAGYGFNIGSKVSLGFTGKFALLLADDPFYPFNVAMGELDAQQILYGYAWGLDAGVIWEPVKSLRVALLLSDFIGSVTPVSDMSSGTVGEFMDGDISGPSGGYDWNIDVSTGITWQPEWRVVQPKFSLDFYDLVGLTREYTDENYTSFSELYSSDTIPFLWHMRVGANFRFFKFLDLGASYYREYFTLGLGVDIKFFELFVEVKTLQDFSNVGANALLKFKF